jgi:hypothetical protein
MAKRIYASEHVAFIEGIEEGDFLMDSVSKEGNLPGTFVFGSWTEYIRTERNKN